MSHVATPLIALRYGELFLKGQNRHTFERQLEQNLRRALSGLPSVKLERGQGRIFLSGDAQELRSAEERARRVFGFSSLSRALAVPSDLDALAAGALSLVEREGPASAPRSFKVETQRSDKRFPFPSPEISRIVGAAIHTTLGWPVDLHHPELVVGVEVGAVQSFVFVGKIPGAGGLPVGTGGRVLLLLSGGIDSPVAGHLMQKRGCTLDALYFHSPPHTSSRARDKVLQLAERLAWAQGQLALHVVPFTAVQEQIRDRAPAELSVVLYRRMMMRIASRLAQSRRCLALATGESLGQVASQTLGNLACIEAAAELPVLRPLLSFDKTETIALARQLGSYEISILPYDDCCSLFVPRHPSTRVAPADAEAAEAELPVEALLAAAVEGTERLVLPQPPSVG